MTKLDGIEQILSKIESFVESIPVNAQKESGTDCWMSISEITSSNILPLGRDVLYAEIKIAEYCRANNLACDLQHGIHYVDLSKLDLTPNSTTKRYKINVPEFKIVVVQGIDTRVPKRPIDPTLCKALKIK